MLYKLAATRAYSFISTPPFSLPPSFPSRYRPTNTKEPNKNKRPNFWTTFRDSPYESDLILVTQLRAVTCCPVIVHNPVWDLHTSAATPPSSLFSVASMTNLVGHVLGTSISLKHVTTHSTKCIYLPFGHGSYVQSWFSFFSVLSKMSCVSWWVVSVFLVVAYVLLF